MTLCVYALVRTSPARLPVTGVAGERLRLVGRDHVSAVVGQLPRAPRPTADNLRRYDRTLSALAGRFPALLPARFGTCFDNPEELLFVLRSRRQSLRRALAHVRRRAQMTVRIIGSGAAERAGDTGEVGGASDEPSGTAYLRQRAAAAARERHVPGFDGVRDAVRGSIRDERVEKRGATTTVYHLVPRASAVAYRAAVERAAAAAGLQVVVSGPWPPYAFATW